MSSVRGKISIDVQFADSTTSSGVQSLKTIALQDVTEYTSGKVATVTGTVGTAGVAVFSGGALSAGYRNASGELVAFTGSPNIKRLVASSQALVEYFISGPDVLVYSGPGSVAVTDLGGSDAAVIAVRALAGTASYTLVLYGT